MDVGVITMEIFQYKLKKLSITGNHNEIEKKLLKVKRQGWDLVTVFVNKDGVVTGVFEQWTKVRSRL